MHLLPIKVGSGELDLIAPDDGPNDLQRMIRALTASDLPARPLESQSVRPTNFRLKCLSDAAVEGSGSTGRSL
jgi:hypothetical protein